MPFHWKCLIDEKKGVKLMWIFLEKLSKAENLNQRPCLNTRPFQRLHGKGKGSNSSNKEGSIDFLKCYKYFSNS